MARTHDSAVALCKFDDLADGDARGFDLIGEGRDTVFVIRFGESVRVYRNRCPHQGASLPWRKHAYLSGDGARIVCHAHGAQFDIDSGECVLGPALGQSLERLDATVDSHGRVIADLSMIRS